jgi:hypothetical protein
MTNENFNDKFKCNDDNQIFLKDFQNESRYIIPDGTEKIEITEKDDIVLPINVDTEYTANLGNLKKLTVEQLENRTCEFKSQIENHQKIYDVIEKNFMLRASEGKVSNKKISELEKFISVKHKRSTLISTQFKSPSYQNQKILFNPKLEKFIRENTSEKEEYLSSDFHILDFLKCLGINCEVNTEHSDLKTKDFNQLYKYDENGKQIMTCTFLIYCYFMLADILKIFQGLYLKRFEKAILDDEIDMQSRIANVGPYNNSTKFSPNWTIEIDGKIYKLKFDLVDIGSLQGKISYADSLKNTNLYNEDKGLMDKYKSNMLLGYVKHPKDFVKYALNDLQIYDILYNFNNIYKDIYKDLNVSEHFEDCKLTVGSNVQKLLQSVMKKNLNIPVGKDGDKELDGLLIHSSPNIVGSFDTDHNGKGDKKIKRRHGLAKTMGGRCTNNLQILRYEKEKKLTNCDIDVTSAYTTIMSNIPFHVGRAVIESFHDGRMTLREFYEKIIPKIDKRGFKVCIKTMKDLNLEQDLIYSQTNLKFSKDKNPKFDAYGSLIKTTENVDLKNIEIGLYSKFIKDGHMTWDDFDFITNRWQKKHLDHFLDNVCVVSSIYHPLELKCKDYQDLKRKTLEHRNKKCDGGGKGIYQGSGDGYIEICEEDTPHYWFPINFGKMIMDDIIQYRRLNKRDGNHVKAGLFKLIGNTCYGVSVSNFFSTSNIIFATNITSICRLEIYGVEKGLNTSQTITDGGINDINKVSHFLHDRQDPTILTRRYSKSKRELNIVHNHCQYKPLSEDGKDITYKEGLGWTCDDVLYPFDVFKTKKLMDERKKSIYELGESHPTSIILEKEIKVSLKGEEDFKKRIAFLSSRHLKKQYHNVDVFSGKFNKIKVDEDGIAFKNDDGSYVYEDSKGLVSFEVKNFCHQVGLHATANYRYLNHIDEITAKMRSFEGKKAVTALLQDDSGVYFCEKYYNKTPIDEFLGNIYSDTNVVPVLPPYVEKSIVKIKDWRNNCENYYFYTNLLPGETKYKLKMFSVYSMCHRFLNHEQSKNWKKYHQKLKDKYGGLGLEIFFMYVKDGLGFVTLDNMYKVIDELIIKGVMNPAEYFDKHRNRIRNLKRNDPLKKFLDKHIEKIKSGKNMIRIMNVGIHRFFEENSKKTDDGFFHLKNSFLSENLTDDLEGFDYRQNDDQVDKYSDCHEFSDYDGNLKAL